MHLHICNQRELIELVKNSSEIDNMDREECLRMMDYDKDEWFEKYIRPFYDSAFDLDLESNNDWIHLEEFIHSAVLDLRENPCDEHWKIFELVLLSCIERDAEFCRFTPEELKSDKEFMLAALKYQSEVFKYFPEELRSDYKIAGNAIEQWCYNYEFISDTLKDNRELAIKALEEDVSNYEFFSQNLKNDKAIVKYVLKNRRMGTAMLPFVPKEYTEDPKFMWDIYLENGRIFEALNKNKLVDNEFWLDLCNIGNMSGEMLRYLPEELQKDKEFILKMIDNYPFVYGFIDDKLKLDIEIVKTALKKSPYVYHWLPKELKDDDRFLDFYLNEYKDKEYCLQIVQTNGHNLKKLSAEMQDDKDVVLAAIDGDPTLGGKFTPEALQYASDRLKDDDDVVNAALKVGGSAIQYASERFRHDEKFVLRCIESSSRTICYVDKKFKRRDFYLKALEKNKSVFQYLDERYRNDIEMALLAIFNKKMFQYVSDQLKNNREFWLAAASRNINVLDYLSDQYDDDEEFWLYVCEIKCWGSHYVPQNLRTPEFASKVKDRTGVDRKGRWGYPWEK